MKNPATMLFLLFSMAGAAAGSQTPIPQGGEFQINTYTTYFQVKPVAAPGTDGDFLVVWQSSGSSETDDSASSVQGQRYNAAGSPIGGEFQINTYTTRNQDEPAIAARPGGGFVVVWDSYGSTGTDTSDDSIQGQRLDASGRPVGSQFQVNTYTTMGQNNPDVGVGSGGNFVVVWESFGSAGTDSDALSIHGQRFDTAGTEIGVEFQVNTHTPSSQLTPRVAVDSDGDFVVVWNSLSGGNGDSSSSSIQGQRYDTNGLPIGDEFLVNTYTTGAQNGPGLALGADDGFIAVWGSAGGLLGTDTSFSSIQAQRFDSLGNTVGSQFQVNTYTSLNQLKPTVSSDPLGNFIVAWEDFNSPTDGSYSAVEGQLFDAAGNEVGGQFEVNTYTTHLQQDISVAIHPGGDFLVTWESRGGSFGTDSSYSSIQGQRYASPIFADGFESGDTSSWSSTQ